MFGLRILAKTSTADILVLVDRAISHKNTLLQLAEASCSVELDHRSAARSAELGVYQNFAIEVATMTSIANFLAMVRLLIADRYEKLFVVQRIYVLPLIRMSDRWEIERIKELQSCKRLHLMSAPSAD